MMLNLTKPLITLLALLLISFLICLPGTTVIAATIQAATKAATSCVVMPSITIFAGMRTILSGLGITMRRSGLIGTVIAAMALIRCILGSVLV
ncbi:hypothetical protein FD47_GL000819 [Lentilactobacillus parafarraginis DSM 18390 = JCM 14109]|uniref:Uncharacterized protein n=1 Tax=Lentilactobacillus parafarraginis DSM 18390 = JCM 14109 TaxID=1423786 RepID=A0A0R1YPJ0_9LACO|nr:hypothetical protein FD47_GL000819 [Lentilactobacillus parafarraginis DSM 18390 = JCM 14109]